MPYTYSGERAEEVNAVLRALEQAFGGAFGEALAGLYLHGSMAMGSFRPWSSDVDLLAVVLGPLPREVKLDLIRRVMVIAEGGEAFRKIELSVLTADEAARARHPIGYILHYSNTWHERFRQGSAELVIEGGGDEDLAAHVSVLHARGKVLCGPPIAEVFGAVPRRDYLSAVLYDIGGAREAIAGEPMYTTLNLCRTLCYLRHGFIGSKREGGEWALGEPEFAAHRPVIAAALTEYATAESQRYDPAALQALAADFIARIAPLLPEGLAL